MSSAGRLKSTFFCPFQTDFLMDPDVCNDAPWTTDTSMDGKPSSGRYRWAPHPRMRPECANFRQSRTILISFERSFSSNEAAATFISSLRHLYLRAIGMAKKYMNASLGLFRVWTIEEKRLNMTCRSPGKQAATHISLFHFIEVRKCGQKA